MSKNIVIQEGGIAKQMTASKLKTNLVGSGTCLWVPEDETTLKTKNISNNGTYAASSDNAYGFSQVTVNVAGGDGSATSSGKPTTSNGVDPGGIGSSVIGKDTSGVISGTPGGDGNEYAIGIDSSGNIVATKVPSAIEIGKVPDKTEYVDGETIDYSGIIVILKGGDSAMFSNADYPNGRVPFSELVFPVEKAEGGSEGGSAEIPSDLSIDGVASPIPFASSYVARDTRESRYDVHVDGPANFASCIVNAYYAGMFAASKSPGVSVHAHSEGGYDLDISLSSSFTHDGKTVYYAYSSFNLQFGPDYEAYPTPCGNSPYLGNQAGKIAWVIEYGHNTQGSQEIPVQWVSPYDGRTFEDTFEITVTGSSGGGYSDDSGGSESGGGGNF